MTTETAIWMVDWQSESDLDSICNTCDVSKFKERLHLVNLKKIAKWFDSILKSAKDIFLIGRALYLCFTFLNRLLQNNFPFDFELPQVWGNFLCWKVKLLVAMAPPLPVLCPWKVAQNTKWLHQTTWMLYKQVRFFGEPRNPKMEVDDLPRIYFFWNLPHFPWHLLKLLHKFRLIGGYLWH